MAETSRINVELTRNPLVNIDDNRWKIVIFVFIRPTFKVRKLN